MSGEVKARRGLSRELVVEAALRAADAQGIDALSLRRLARSLGVTPMAIYRHVRNRSHLLELMAERLLEQVDLAPSEEESWQERLRRLLRSYQAVVATHPATPMLLSRPFGSRAALRASEALLAILGSAGFDAERSMRLMQVISGMLLGPAIHRAQWATAATQDPASALRQQASMEALPADEYPSLATAIERFRDWSPGPEADRLVLELLVRGVEALAHQSNRGQPAGS